MGKRLHNMKISLLKFTFKLHTNLSKLKWIIPKTIVGDMLDTVIIFAGKLQVKARLNCPNSLTAKNYPFSPPALERKRVNFSCRSPYIEPPEIKSFYPTAVTIGENFF